MEKWRDWGDVDGTRRGQSNVKNDLLLFAEDRDKWDREINCSFYPCREIFFEKSTRSFFRSIKTRKRLQFPFFLFFFNPSFVFDFQNSSETLVVSLERSREKEISPLYHNFVEREGGPVSPFFLFFFNPSFVFDFQNCSEFP